MFTDCYFDVQTSLKLYVLVALSEPVLIRIYFLIKSYLAQRSLRHMLFIFLVSQIN